MAAQTQSIPARDVSALCRKSLAEAFPGTSFTVKLSTGRCIDVRWTDGPPMPAVEQIADRFAGAWFDGMTDYQGGYVVTVDDQESYLGTRFVFLDRQLSREAYDVAIEKMEAAGHDTEWLELQEWGDGFVSPISNDPSRAVFAPDGQPYGNLSMGLARWFDHDRPADQLTPRATTIADRVQRVRQF